MSHQPGTSSRDTDVCGSCGAVRNTPYCGVCGEKRVTPHDYSVAHFVEHVAEHITHVDFRAVRALKALVFHPGLLTRDYLAGRRNVWVSPTTLFVAVNIVFALIGPNSFRTPLATQERDLPFPALKQALITQALARSGVERETFAEEFDRTATTHGKTWVFAIIPLFALCIAALYGFRRYVFEHLIFATHFCAFLMVALLGFGAAAVLIVGGLGLHPADQQLDYAVSVCLPPVLATYLYIAFRRVYGDSRTSAGVRAIAMVLLILPIVLVYRFLLFFVTLWTMH